MKHSYLELLDYTAKPMDLISYANSFLLLVSLYQHYLVLLHNKCQSQNFSFSDWMVYGHQQINSFSQGNKKYHVIDKTGSDPLIIVLKVDTREINKCFDYYYDILYITKHFTLWLFVPTPTLTHNNF